MVDGRLAGAGLDVFADEPNVPEALLSMDNVVVLPHVASGTVETRAAMEDLTLRNLNSFLESGRLSRRFRCRSQPRASSGRADWHPRSHGGAAACESFEMPQSGDNGIMSGVVPCR